MSVDNRPPQDAWSPESEQAVNAQISVELDASLAYEFLASQFRRPEVFLPKLTELFSKDASEERKHADLLVDLQVIRGGNPQMQLTSPHPPTCVSGVSERITAGDLVGSVLTAFRAVLELEEHVWDRLHKLWSIAQGDPHFTDYVEGKLLSEQAEGTYVARRRLNTLQSAATSGAAGILVWMHEEL